MYFLDSSSAGFFDPCYLSDCFLHDCTPSRFVPVNEASNPAETKKHNEDIHFGCAAIVIATHKFYRTCTT
jgi:hypothetical protein